MRFTRVYMGTSRICFKYLKLNVLWIKMTYLAFLAYSFLFDGVWGRFEAFSASYRWWWCPTIKRVKAGWLKSNHRTANAKIFTRNERKLFKSRSAEAWITRLTVLRSLVHKSHRNGLKIARLPAQICLSRCCIMRILNGWDTRFESRRLATAPARQKQHSVWRSVAWRC